MNKNLNYDILVARYLAGDLTLPEQEAFEREVKTNPRLSRVLNLHRRVDDALSEEDVNHLRDMLEEIHQDVTGKKRNLWWIKYAAAALVLLLIAASIWFILHPGKSYSDEQLFAAYYYVYESPGPDRSAASGLASFFDTGLQFYDNHDYNAALINLSQATLQDPSNTASGFYAALSLMELNRNSEAIPLLEEVINRQDVLYSEQSKWYLALNALKIGNQPAAVKLLQELKETSRFYRKDCSEILKKLKISK